MDVTISICPRCMTHLFLKEADPPQIPNDKRNGCQGNGDSNWREDLMYGISHSEGTSAGCNLAFGHPIVQSESGENFGNVQTPKIKETVFKLKVQVLRSLLTKSPVSNTFLTILEICLCEKR